MRERLFASFRHLAWDKVLGAAPNVSEAARVLWNRVSGGAGAAAVAVPQTPSLNPEMVAALVVLKW